jgi:putative acetyltransferase
MEIRAETPSDYEVVGLIVEQALSPNEARLVELIRQSDNYVPELALVAEEERRVVGYALFSYVSLKGDQLRTVLALAPMAVAPPHQGKGIGSVLVRAGLECAEARSEPLVSVLGHATYYPRFGFEPARPHGIEPPWETLPDEVWMVKLLSGYDPQFQGQVVYPPAFDVT